MPLRLGLIGFPVDHSISPALQQPAFDALGIDATYQLWSTSYDEIEQRIQELRHSDCLGANVTAPHKQVVVPFLDEIAESANRAGAVNTIVHQDDALTGHNTDVYGLATAIRNAQQRVGADHVVILGAGGAARAAVLAVESLGATSIFVANRTRSTSEQLAASLGVRGTHVVDRTSDRLRQRWPTVDIVINATSLGWNRGELPASEAEISMLPSDSLVVDLVYRDTDFQRIARARGLATLDGLPMLVHQGARAFELWTGRQAPLDIMMDAAIRARSSNA